MIGSLRRGKEEVDERFPEVEMEAMRRGRFGRRWRQGGLIEHRYMRGYMYMCLA